MSIKAPTFSAADEIHASGMGVALNCKDCQRSRKMFELGAIESERVRIEARDRRAEIVQLRAKIKNLGLALFGVGFIAGCLIVNDLVNRVGGCR